MTRGTTPTHTFTLPVDTDRVKSIRALYAQEKNIVLRLNTERFNLNGRTAKVKLTQEETLKFDETKLAEVQIRILTLDGDSLASNVKWVSVGRLLEDEVLE